MDLATTAGTAIKYENTGLASDTTRHYRVSAVNKAVPWARFRRHRHGAHPLTAPGVTSEPGKPTGLTAKAVRVAGTDTVELSWTAPVAGRDSVTGYKIRNTRP